MPKTKPDKQTVMLVRLDTLLMPLAVKLVPLVQLEVSEIRLDWQVTGQQAFFLLYMVLVACYKNIIIDMRRVKNMND